MSCVNIKHEDFINLSKELDLHPNSLEEIIYKFQNSSKDNEGKFPSAEYVRQAIKGKSMTNATEDHIRLWNSKYKDPKTFKSIEEANAYMAEANKYFNKESITIETTRAGNYRVEVAQPFSEEKFNIEPTQIFDVLSYIAKTLKYTENNINYEVISKLNNEFYITKHDVLKAKRGLEQYRILAGFPPNIFDIKENNGNIKVTINTSVLKDTIERNQRNANFGDLFESSKEAESVENVLNFLSAKTGLKYKTITFSEAKNIINNLDNNTNAFVHKGVCYFIEGRKLNTDIASEEMLHPFVAALRKQNPVLFNNLFREAQKTFPKLRLEIAESYKERSAEERQEELVTQALSRAFRIELENHPQRRNIESLLKHFLDWVKDLFKVGNKDYIIVDEISADTSLVDLAKIINTDLKLLYNSSYNDLTRLNQFDENEYIKEQLKSYTFYSGAAEGSDQAWAEAARELGIEIVEYTSHSWNTLPNTWKNKLDAEYRSVAEDLGRPVIDSPLVRRDMMQADKADAIFAIGTVVKPGSRGAKYVNNSNQEVVDGGTGYAVQRGIQRNIPIYVYDQSDNQWKKWDTANKMFIPTTEPILTPKAATIGTRKLQDNGKQAIQSILQKTIDTFQGKQTEEKSSKEEEDAKYYAEQQMLWKQLDNLYSTNLMSTSEIGSRARKIAYYISDLITAIQTNDKQAVSMFGESYKDIDFSRLSRADVVRFIGVDNLVLAAKLQFSPSKIQESYKKDGKDVPRKLMSKYRLLQNNWNAMMELALPEFHRIEKFSLKHSDGSIGKFTYESFDVDTYQDEAIIQEQEGNSQEHWQIENRTIEIVGSLSQEMRDALKQCYVLDSNGDKVKDSDGIYERVNIKDAVNSILRWTQGSTKLSQMIVKLESKAKNNPWITQIINRLKDTSGKEADFQSQFFTVFDMHFQSYSVGIKNKDGYSASIVNENPALKSIVNEITAIYNIGKHPMFTLNGVNKEKFEEFKEAVDKISKIKKSNTEEVDIEEAINAITKTLNLLGYPITAEEVFKEYTKGTFNKVNELLDYIKKAIESQLNNSNYQPFNFNDKNSILGNLRELLKPFTDKLEDTTVQTTYDNGKMYQSYITPSYLSKLMLKFQLEGEEFESFMLEEYGKYSWFRYDKEDFANGWRNSWLRDLARNNDSARELFKHTVLLNFDKKHYMRDMSDMEYLMSVLSMYFDKKSNGDKTPAWFRVPMLSNKPSSEFIRFFSERGIDYRDTITDNLKLIFDQELSRIQTVLMRSYDKSDSRFIKNFDKNGKRFNFLTYMNDYLEGGSKSNTELGKLIQNKVKGLKVDESKLENLAWKAIKDNMQQKADEILNKWEEAGIFTETMKIKNLNIDNVREELENFIWNDTLAAINIMELTITDPAFYKDAEDIQKRFAQIHSPGVRGNIEATDYQGNRVSDGYERTIYLTDFDDFKSNIIENLEIVFGRKIAEAKTEEEKKSLEVLKDSLLRKPIYDNEGNLIDAGGEYWKINVADAQAYNSPDSYRKKALIFGKWSKEKEAIWEKLRSGEYTHTDLQSVFQPLKPFKYTQMEKESHVNSTMSNLKVPVQNKNAEYLLVLAGAMLQDVDTGKPNILRAIYNIMQETSKDAPTRGIDTVQFTSAVKSGEMGAIDIKRFYDSPGGEQLAYETLKQALYKDGKYNPDAITETLHKTPFEDYCLQQEVPPHFLDHEQIHGSQVRYVTIADLETEYNGQEVTYNLEGKQVSAKEFKEEYEKTIAENIEESIIDLSKELNVYSEDKRTRNLALSKILQKEIDDDPRYGVDLKLACSLDENGNFRIPLGDPIQAKRIEQLLNSVIKNRINKQEIAGGPVVQVSNFGTSKQLNIRFKSKKEGETLLQTRAEFKGTDAEYKTYIQENQAGVAYYECFAPVYSQDLFKYFAKEDGTIDIEAIEKTHPELLKMVGYRIPTENKYSCVPMKIVGFLPKEAGEGIMLPYDITLITGSDFDVKNY